MPEREPSEYEFVTSKTLGKSGSFAQAKDTNRKAVEMGLQILALNCLRSQKCCAYVVVEVCKVGERAVRR